MREVIASRCLTSAKVAARLVALICVGLATASFTPWQAPTSPSPERPVAVESPPSNILQPIDKASAFALNAAEPVAAGLLQPAAPLLYAGTTANLSQAKDCLAMAMWYEAGNDPDGQKAVGQVVVNRARHPAFPTSICGVVFQGSERATGCQFTFTCDGSLVRRHPSALALEQARIRAAGILAGAIYPAVGDATHYHTDWVRPIWSPQLQKIAKVGTHLFFRWPGARGNLMAHRVGGLESIPSGLDEPAGALALDGAGAAVDLTADLDVAQTVAQSLIPSPKSPGRVGSEITLTATQGGSGSNLAFAALDACGDQPFCKVVGRVGDSGAPRFLYVRDRRTGVEKTLWDCSFYERPTARGCGAEEFAKWLRFEGNLSSMQQAET